jgi:hypothetical protein
LYGSAFCLVTPNASRFNDVDVILLKDIDKNALFGGTLLWQQSVDDNSECGIAGFDASGGYYPRTELRYMVNCPLDDFAANEETKISITGICTAYTW